MEVDKLLQDKREAILKITTQHGARNVQVFGSMVRGEAKPDSDLDLLVTLDQGRTLLDLIAIKQDLEDLLQREVDVVTEAAISPYMKEQVLKEAVNL
jgi:predicted nucleotidyltransferase